jgi:hypothetical protein
MRACLLACLLPFSALALRAGAELHVSKVGEAPDFVGLRFAGDTPPLRLEANLNHVMPSVELPAATKARLFGEPAEAGLAPADLGDLTLPAAGRHLLLLCQTGDARVRTRLLPFDENALPVGGVRFLNLTSRRMRCFIDTESVELGPDETKLHPAVSAPRRIVNHRLELKSKEGWKVDTSTTLILSANRRFLFILLEDNPRSPLRRELVTDFDPVRNLARRVTPPVKAEPPLPDPPAK